LARVGPKTDKGGPWGAIADRLRDREVRRQISHNNVRKALTRVKLHLAAGLTNGAPAVLPDFLKALGQGLVGFWIIAAVLQTTLNVQPLHTLAALGLFYSLQATYYKHRLARDPGYKIPKCRCAAGGNDATEKVLASRESSILRVPTSLLGALWYASILVLVSGRYAGALQVLVIVPVCASAYLSYVMVQRLGNLCGNCINVAALNILILVSLLL